MLIGNRYELLSRLGQGGMGVVYEARDRLSGSHVALKRVPLEALSGTLAATVLPSASSRDRRDSMGRRALLAALAQEFHTLAALRHPNIISVLDYGFDHEHTPFFTMELLPSPKPIVAAGAKLGTEAQLDLLLQLLRALSYLHRHRLIHRDLKPSNVLVVEREGGREVKVLDFGIVATRGSDVALAGTLEYMAPEVICGQAPTEAADLYSVGVMLHEMLTGQFPYHAQLDAEIATHGSQAASFVSALTMPPMLAEALLRLRARVPSTPVEISGPLKGIVQRLLANDPMRRYRDAQEVMAALCSALGRPLQLDTTATRESFLSASVLVGRERELGILQAALSRAERGEGGAILLAGESGVGKSRLLDELRCTALVRGIRVLRGQAANTAGGSYDVFLDPLRALVLDTRLDAQEATVLNALLPELPELIGMPIVDAPQLSAQATQKRLQRVLLDVLTRSTGPVLLLLEDIHWVEPDSLELLRELMRKARQSAILIIASAREDERSDLTRVLPEAELLHLARLDQQGISALSQSMLGEAGAHTEILSLLSRETEGNTYFIVEVVRALAEEAGGLDLVGKKALPQHVFAGGVQAVVTRRLNRTPPWARPLLKTAAVAGRKIDRRILGRLEPELELWLQTCAEAAILEATEAEWRFTHDKLREQLLESLDPQERRELHQRIGETIEQIYGAEPSHVSALAYHFDEARELSKAARYLAMAGALALRRGAVREAEALLERAMPLQERTGQPPLERAATLRRLSRALYGLGRHADCLDAAGRAMALLGRPIPATATGRMLANVKEVAREAGHRLFGLKPLSHPMDRATAQEFLVLTRGTSDAYFIAKGRLDEALYVMLGALHVAENLDDAFEQVNYLMMCALIAYSMPLHRLGRYYRTRAQALLPRMSQPLERGSYDSMASYMYSAEGKWQESLDALSRWLRSVEKTGDEGQQALIHRTRGAIHMALGQLDKLQAAGEASMRLGKRLDNDTVIAASHLCQGMFLYYRGETARGLDALQKALAILEQGSTALHKLIANGMLSAVAARGGELALAREQLSLALRRMARVHPPSMQYLEGYGGAVESALLLWQQAGTRPGSAEEQQVRQAVWQMTRFAWVFPVGRPRALLGLGRYLLLRRMNGWSLRCLLGALRESQRFAMPVELALSHYWLALCTVSAKPLLKQSRQDACMHLRKAIEGFSAMGMVHEHAQAVAELARHS